MPSICAVYIWHDSMDRSHAQELEQLRKCGSMGTRSSAPARARHSSCLERAHTAPGLLAARMSPPGHDCSRVPAARQTAAIARAPATAARRVTTKTRAAMRPRATAYRASPRSPSRIMMVPAFTDVTVTILAWISATAASRASAISFLARSMRRADRPSWQQGPCSRRGGAGWRSAGGRRRQAAAVVAHPVQRPSPHQEDARLGQQLPQGGSPVLRHCPSGHPAVGPTRARVVLTSRG